MLDKAKADMKIPTSTSPLIPRHFKQQSNEFEIQTALPPPNVSYDSFWALPVYEVNEVHKDVVEFQRREDPDRGCGIHLAYWD